MRIEGYDKYDPDDPEVHYLENEKVIVLELEQEEAEWLRDLFGLMFTQKKTNSDLDHSAVYNKINDILKQGHMHDPNFKGQSHEEFLGNLFSNTMLSQAAKRSKEIHK